MQNVREHISQVERTMQEQVSNLRWNIKHTAVAATPLASAPAWRIRICACVCICMSERVSASVRASTVNVTRLRPGAFVYTGRPVTA